MMPVVVPCVACLALAAAPAALALPPGRYLEPVWAYSSTAPLEWVAAGDGFGVLATARGDVHVFDVATGPPSGAQPLATTPGVRFAGSADEHAFFFDRVTVYACALYAPGVWAWQFATNAAPANRPDDPEQLPGWNEVQAVPGGPLVATGDGRLRGQAGALVRSAAARAPGARRSSVVRGRPDVGGAVALDDAIAGSDAHRAG